MNYSNKNDFVQGNPVLIGPKQSPKIRKQPGIYMLYCFINEYKYYGQSSDISLRIAGHKNRLRGNKHWIKALQDDWNNFGESSFAFYVLHTGDSWAEEKKRLEEETKLIVNHFKRLSNNLEKGTYNLLESLAARKGELNPFFEKKHSEESKQKMSLSKKGRPNNLLGKKVEIAGVTYLSVADASRVLLRSRKLIRDRVNNKVKFFDWKWVTEDNKEV